MKAEPTDMDREAARLFTAAPGMRVIWSDRLYGGLWARISVAGERVAGCYEVGTGTWDIWSMGMRGLDAIDTDDAATVGAMLTQVEAARPGATVSVIDRLLTLPNDPVRRFAALVTSEAGVQDVFTRPTRGAALVAAMRAVRAAK